MASYVKEKLTGVPSSSDSGNPSKYFIQVFGATSYDDNTGKQITINGPPTSVSPHAKVSVRIKEYQGLPLSSPPTSSYFNDPAHSRDTYSIAVSWIPDQDISAEDLVWGIELINPIRDRIPKRFINTAFDIVKGFVDPSLRCDPYADQPWLNGPILCSTAITFNIGSDKLSHPDILTENHTESDTKLREKLSIPTSEAQRRKHFATEAIRKSFIFEKGRCYNFDFHNGYIDWKNYALKLPGFSFGVLRFIDDRTHTTRFVLKNRKTGELYVATTFKLLFGEELEKAKRQSESQGNKNGAAGTEHSPDGENLAEDQKPPSESRESSRSDLDDPRDEEQERPTRDGEPDQPTSNLPQEPELAQGETRSKHLSGSRSGLPIGKANQPTIPPVESTEDLEVKSGNGPRGSIEESLMATASKDNRT